MLSEKIKQYRAEHNLTQEDFAAKLFVTRNAVSKWENDNGYPNIETLKDIAKLLNLSIDELLGEDDVKTMVVDLNSKYYLLKKYLFDFFVFLSYGLIGILIPLLMTSLDPTSIMVYCFLIGPISFALLGVLTPLYNKNVLHTLISCALAITPILIFFELSTNVVIYLYEITYFILFIAFYLIMLRVLKINLKKNATKLVKWISLGVFIFLVVTYVVVCVTSFLTYSESSSAPIYTRSLICTCILIIPIIISLVLFLVFRKKTNGEDK
ncbi:MAG: helix-turn-helix transcriptional regulator [Bacilli bacterium]